MLSLALGLDGRAQQHRLPVANLGPGRAEAAVRLPVSLEKVVAIAARFVFCESESGMGSGLEGVASTPRLRCNHAEIRCSVVPCGAETEISAE